MNDYETVIILSPNLDEKGIEEELGKVSSLVASIGGEVKEIEKWGRRRFAYEIKKQKEGTYSLLKFRSPAAGLTELDRKLRMNERILRHLTVSSEVVAPSEEAEVAGDPS